MAMNVPLRHQARRRLACLAAVAAALAAIAPLGGENRTGAQCERSARAQLDSASARAAPAGTRGAAATAAAIADHGCKRKEKVGLDGGAATARARSLAAAAHFQIAATAAARVCVAAGAAADAASVLLRQAAQKSAGASLLITAPIGAQCISEMNAIGCNETRDAAADELHRFTQFDPRVAGREGRCVDDAREIGEFVEAFDVEAQGLRCAGLLERHRDSLG